MGNNLKSKGEEKSANILLLGTGDSGKTTFFKQTRHLKYNNLILEYEKQSEEDEINKEYIFHIYYCIYTGLLQSLNYCKKNQIEINNIVRNYLYKNI